MRLSSLDVEPRMDTDQHGWNGIARVPGGRGSTRAGAFDIGPFETTDGTGLRIFREGEVPPEPNDACGSVVTLALRR